MTIDQVLAWLRGLSVELLGDRWDPEDWRYGGDTLAHVRNVLPQLIAVVEAASCSDPDQAYLSHQEYLSQARIDYALMALAAAVEKEKG